MAVGDRDILIDSHRRPTVDSHRRPHTKEQEVCCCPCVLHRWYYCKDGTPSIWFIDHASIHGFSAKLDTATPDECMFLRGCYSEIPPDVGGAGVPPVLTWFPACQICQPAFVCAPGAEEDLTDEEVEALFPNVTAVVVGMNVCGCYVVAAAGGPGFDSTETHASINGHGFMLVPSGITRLSPGYSQGYAYGSSYPTNPADPNLFVGTTWFTSPDCSPTDFSEDKSGTTTTFGITLSCQHFEPEDTDATHINGWSYDVSDCGVGGNLTDCFAPGFGVLPKIGPWSGAGGVVATVANAQTVDGDCNATTGMGPQDPCGDGNVNFIATA